MGSMTAKAFTNWDVDCCATFRPTEVSMPKPDPDLRLRQPKGFECCHAAGRVSQQCIPGQGNDFLTSDQELGS